MSGLPAFVLYDYLLEVSAWYVVLAGLHAVIIVYFARRWYTGRPETGHPPHPAPDRPGAPG